MVVGVGKGDNRPLSDLAETETATEAAVSVDTAMRVTLLSCAGIFR